MGPRPLDFPAGKRYVHITPAELTDQTLTGRTTRSVSNSVLQSNGIHGFRGASAVASQDPYTNELTINDISRFSFASIAPANPRSGRESSDYDNFLEPTFNFDDFHDHITTTTEPNLRDFPLPGATRPSQNNSDESEIQLPVPQQSKPASQVQPAIPVPTRKSSGTAQYSTPLSRKTSAASTTSRMSNKSDAMQGQPTHTQSILRGRRQSQFPPNAFNNPTSSTASSKAPRKSIGPGTFVPPDTTKADTVKRRPSVGARKASTDSKSGLSLRLNTRKGEPMSDGKSQRTIRAKSFMGGKSQSSNDLLTPSKSPEGRRPTSSHVPNTPNRRSGTPGRTTTPGTTGKRMSVMPGHGGLGARTISPTDARRMKRMSIVPPAPPIPQSRISQAPPTPTEPMPTRPRSTVQSPAGVNRKSLTPSSSRTTPDPNRKSYSSGQSLSSATSYTSSVRNSASLSARLSQNLNSSRLPTPKPRIDISGTVPVDAEVPPVPAIPKAYESPSSEFDQPFFSARSSSLPGIESPITASPQVTNFESAMKTLETPRAPSSSSKFSQSVPAPEQDARQKPQPKNSKKSTQNLRLPPLNLLPLSTPTAAKIKAFKESRAEATDGPATPPPYRGAKTPSTPMTASKASFFSKSNRAQDEAVMRSSTSHYALRPDPLLSPANESPSLPAFTFETGSNDDRGISPFVSSSLPKNDDFANYMRPNFNAEFHRTPQAKPNGPRAPSFSITPKLGPEPSPVEKSDQESSALDGLRRKLSRKRADSKPEQKMLEDTAGTAHGNMPPPKLPASATWSNNLHTAASPVQKPQTFLRSRRQASGSSNTFNPQRQESIDSNITHISTSRPSMESVRSFMQHSNRSGSVSSMAAQPKAVAKPQAQPPQEPALDRDDMLAEEEMKRLASKRRDFESAARELDALRARACPARRIAASTASQLHTLNIFERGEIVDYADIYFCGTLRARKIVGDPSNTATNFGYDDDRGDYNIVEGDHLAYRYEVVDILGKGSFGQVVRCIDHKTGILVAVKIIRNKKRFHQQALVEVNILQKLKEWVRGFLPNTRTLLTCTRIPTRSIVSLTSIRASISVGICASRQTFLA